MLDALTLDQMRVFAAVADCGSFRAAAARLSRAQSAVSHAVATLEGQLGLAVFDRSGHRPRIAPEGRALLADVRAILTKVDAVRARARGLRGGVELELAVALDPQFPLDVVAGALKELHDALPAVGVRLLTAPLGAAVAALRDGSCALAVTSMRVPDPRVELEALASVPRAAVAAPGHPLAALSAAGEALGKAALADHVQVVAEDPSALTEGRDFGVLSPGTWRVGDNATKRALILAGVGWGSLPLWEVERDLAEGRLARLAVAEFGPGGETVVRAWLAHRTDRPLGQAARLLRAALLRRVGDRGGEALPRDRQKRRYGAAGGLGRS